MWILLIILAQYIIIFTASLSSYIILISNDNIFVSIVYIVLLIIPFGIAYIYYELILVLIFVGLYLIGITIGSLDFLYSKLIGLTFVISGVFTSMYYFFKMDINTG